MKILVTGGTGQIGSSIVKALAARGDYVRCLVRKSINPGLLNGLSVELVEGDVTEPESLTSAVHGIEAVVHAAGVVSYWRRMNKAMLRVNVDGTRNLLNAAVDAGVRRFLYTSSIASIGYSDDGICDETTSYNWNGMNIGYFDTKRAAELLVRQEKRLEGLTVNPAIVFGAHDIRRNGGRMLFHVWEGTLPGIPPGITTVAVLDDVVAGHLAALDKGRPGERYILGGTILSFKELYTRIAKVLGKSITANNLSRRKLWFASRLFNFFSFFTCTEPMITPALMEIITRNRRYSSQKAIDELGYKPSILEKGITSCWQWYCEQGLV